MPSQKQTTRAPALLRALGVDNSAEMRGALYVLLLLAALLLTPIVVGDDFVYHVFITICLFAGLATAWNIVGGFAGQLSLGHAMYYGIGAYTGMILVNAGITPWIGMFVGAAVSAVVGVLIAYPCFRLKGPFYALASIAFLEVFHVLAIELKWLTGGATGKMVPLQVGWEWMIFRERLPSLIIVFGMLCFTLVVAQVIRHRRLGFYLIATRERESAARAAGIPTVRVRIYAAAISAALVSILGTFHAMYLTFIEPDAAFNLVFSIQIVLFALVGGIGTVFGPLLGVILLVPITEISRGLLGASALGLHGFVYGVILMLVVVFMPDGIVSVLPRRLRAAMDPEEFDDTRGEALDDEAMGEMHPESIKTGERPPVGREVLRVDHLVKNFGGLAVTQDVSLTLREGEVLGIIGPNGAGKTTLFNMLSGFLAADGGSVAVMDANGNVHQPQTPAEFVGLGVGRTFQIVQPFGSMTVEENIMVGAFHRHPGVDAARAAAREIAEELGMARYLHEEARNLPIGGLKRLEVARVMAMRPRILLLDEVMAGINPSDLLEAIRLIKAIRDTGVSIIAIEHVMRAVMDLSDRVIVINSGAVIAEGDPETVVRDEAVIEAYLGKEHGNA
jgi:branched-chain amino acid transport system permease protein